MCDVTRTMDISLYLAVAPWIEQWHRLRKFVAFTKIGCEGLCH